MGNGLSSLLKWFWKKINGTCPSSILIDIVLYINKLFPGIKIKCLPQISFICCCYTALQPINFSDGIPCWEDRRWGQVFDDLIDDCLASFWNALFVPRIRMYFRLWFFVETWSAEHISEDIYNVVEYTNKLLEKWPTVFKCMCPPCDHNIPT